MGGVAEPKKHAPPRMCYLVERGRSALNSEAINRNPKTVENWGAPLGWEEWLTHKERPFPTCNLAERGRSALKGVGINGEEPPKLEALGFAP